MSNWIPVSEGLPPLETPVLVTDGKQILVGKLSTQTWPDEGVYWEAIGVEGYEWEWDFEDICKKRLITHWSALPALP